MKKQLTTIVLSRYFVQISFIWLIIVIPLGSQPISHKSVYISHLSFGCKDSDNIFITQIFNYILTIFCKS